MQIVITLNDTSELKRFLEVMGAGQGPIPTAESVPAPAEPASVPAPALTAPANAEPEAAPAPAPTKPAATRQAVQAKAIALMDAGKQDQLQALLVKYGVPALPSIPEDRLSAFMADLEAM